MNINLVLLVIFLCIGSAAFAQQKSMETMDGQCQPNSQFTRTTATELKQKTVKSNIFTCKSALIMEYTNGRIVVVFSPKDAGKDGIAAGFSGSYARGNINTTSRYLEVDGMYFYGKEFDQDRKESNGHCEIEQIRGKVTSVACLAVTRMKGENVIVSSAIFKPTSYTLENTEKPAAAPSAPPKPQGEPWYGVSADGGRCVPTDMSPAERIEWLRERGIRYDAIDYAGPLINGRVPKVTIIPKTGNYPNWVYYGSRAFCQEKETNIDKYR